ncbi:hypothetical protein ABPG72_007600 [Tetrahymena utriculariae]
MSNQQVQNDQKEIIQQNKHQTDLLNNIAENNQNDNQIQNNLEDSENLTERQLFIIKTYFSSFDRASFHEIQQYLFFQVFINFDQIQDKLNENGYEIGICLEICGESLIFEGIQRQSDNNIIIKIVPSEVKENMKDQLDVINALKGYKHFVKIIECFNVKEEYYIFVMEKYQLNLQQELLLMQTQRQFPEEKFIKMIFNQLHGLMDLHEKNILHLDLKLSNVLLSNDGNYIITDFGASQIKYNGKTIECGSYTKSSSPIEQQIEEQNKEIDFKSDIYSLGIALLKIIQFFKALKKDSQIIKFANEIELIVRAHMTQQDQQYRENCFGIHNRFYKQFQKIKKIFSQEKWFQQINEELELYNDKINNQQQQNADVKQNNQQIEEFFEEIQDALQKKQNQILEEQIDRKIKLQTCQNIKDQILMLINDTQQENKEYPEENQINSQKSPLQTSVLKENKENILANSSASNDQAQLFADKQTSDKTLDKEIDALEQKNVQDSCQVNQKQKEIDKLDLQNLEQGKLKKAIDQVQMWIHEQIESIKSGDQASQKQFLSSFIADNLKFYNVNHLQELIDQIALDEKQSIHLNDV